MSKELEILKSAILLEKRGAIFYRTVAMHTKKAEVAKFFEDMAREEEEHEQILSKQFHAIVNGKRFMPMDLVNKNINANSERILTDEIKAEIASASYEAAAIAAAMSMEEGSIKLYGERAAESSDEAEKALYSTLSRWEEEHLRDLQRIDEQLKEKIWFDNSFWPM